MQRRAPSTRHRLYDISWRPFSRFPPSYLRRGRPSCCTGLTCGPTGRGNTCCALCSRAAASHSSSRLSSPPLLCVCLGTPRLLQYLFFFFFRYCKDLLVEAVPVTRVDFTSVLPRFLSLYVMSFLSPLDLSAAARVSWHWRVLAEQVRGEMSDADCGFQACICIETYPPPPIPPYPRTASGPAAASREAGSFPTLPRRRSPERGRTTTCPASPRWTGSPPGRRPSGTGPSTSEARGRRRRRRRRGGRRGGSDRCSETNSRRRRVSRKKKERRHKQPFDSCPDLLSRNVFQFLEPCASVGDVLQNTL